MSPVLIAVEQQLPREWSEESLSDRKVFSIDIGVVMPSKASFADQFSAFWVLAHLPRRMNGRHRQRWAAMGTLSAQAMAAEARTGSVGLLPTAKWFRMVAIEWTNSRVDTCNEVFYAWITRNKKIQLIQGLYIIAATKHIKRALIISENISIYVLPMQSNAIQCCAVGCDCCQCCECCECCSQWNV